MFPRALTFLFVVSGGVRLHAVPPLVSGDVPTADKGTFELYSGMRYQSENDSVNRQLPTSELVYGISDRQEITFEIPYLSQQGERGFGDAVVGTKYIFIKEAKALPDIAGSFELKLPTGSTSRGLGGGAFGYDLRLRTQKTWGWFTVIGNVGYTVLGEPKFGGASGQRDGLWFASFMQKWRVADKTSLLSEIYLETSEESGEPNRFAANVGFDTEIAHHLTFQAAVGKSLRADNRGGPDLRVYLGLHWVFDAPWKRAAK